MSNDFFVEVILVTPRRRARFGKNILFVSLYDSDEAANLALLFDPPAAELGQIEQSLPATHFRTSVSWLDVVTDMALRWLGGWRDLKFGRATPRQ